MSKNNRSEELDQTMPLTNNGNFYPGEYVILTGEAPPRIEPASYKFQGAITAPWDYFNSKNTLIPFTEQEKQKMIVEVHNGEKPVIVFYQNTAESTNAFNRHEVKGSLVVDQVLSSFGILEEKPWKQIDLYRHMRKYPQLFVEKEQFDLLCKVLPNMKVETQATNETANDNRGNNLLLKEKKTKTGLPERIKMCSEIFPGTSFGIKSFWVKIECEASDSGALSISFFSEELIDLISQGTKKLLGEQIGLFKGAKVPVVEK